MNKKIKLKICGLREVENINRVSALHPDYMGFIFYKSSKRFVGDDFLVPDDLPPTIKRVGVFVNESIDIILKQVSRNKLDYVQLHGNETPNICRELKEHKIGVIKVFSMDNKFDFIETIPYQSLVDFFLFDTKTDSYGGSGKMFDWNILKKYDQQTPFFLSGGLTPENFNQVATLHGMNLHAIDVNSGVEIKPGLKSIEKIKSIKTFLASIV